MNEETHVPRFQLDDANRRGDNYQAKYLAVQVKLDKFTMRDAVNDALSGLDPNTADVDNLRAVLEGRNLRVADDRAIVDFDGVTCTPKEAVELMQGQPDKYSVLFNRPKPKAPTKQDLHMQMLRDMPMDNFIRYKKRRGNDYLTPE